MLQHKNMSIFGKKTNNVEKKTYLLLERLRLGSDGRSCLIPDSEITASRPRDNSFCISYKQFKSKQLTLQNFIFRFLQKEYSYTGYQS